MDQDNAKLKFLYKNNQITLKKYKLCNVTWISNKHIIYTKQLMKKLIT